MVAFSNNKLNMFSGKVRTPVGLMLTQNNIQKPGRRGLWMPPTQASSQGWKSVEKAEPGSGADGSYLGQKLPWVPPDLPGTHHSTLFQIPVTDSLSIPTCGGWAITAVSMLCYAKSLQSCPTLCNPIDGSPPGSPVPGILQERTLGLIIL